ncbi:hypothetical protein [Streptomyces sp. NPDC051561]|uniref:hypothetical protein n=1 Tax=Streptomyces sp. NPDC051561 TaxID=3365658 RepID=UPI0037B88476
MNTTENEPNTGMILTMYHNWFGGPALRVMPWTLISKVDPFHDNKFSSFTACRIP